MKGKVNQLYQNFFIQFRLDFRDNMTQSDSSIKILTSQVQEDGKLKRVIEAYVEASSRREGGISSASPNLTDNKKSCFPPELDRSCRNHLIWFMHWCCCLESLRNLKPNRRLHQTKSSTFQSSLRHSRTNVAYWNREGTSNSLPQLLGPWWQKSD